MSFKIFDVLEISTEDNNKEINIFDTELVDVSQEDLFSAYSETDTLCNSYMEDSVDSNNIATINSLSIECIKQNAITMGIKADSYIEEMTLTLSRESNESVLSIIIDSVKKLFVQFGVFIKKMYTKAVVFMTNIAKQAEKLKIELSEQAYTKFTMLKIDADTEEKIISKLGSSLLLYSNGGVNKEYASKYIASMASTKILDNYKNILTGITVVTQKILRENIRYSWDYTKPIPMDEFDKYKKSFDDAASLDGSVVRLYGKTYKELKVSKFDYDYKPTLTWSTFIGYVVGISPIMVTSKAPVEKINGKLHDVDFKDLIAIVGMCIEPANKLKDFAKDVEKDVENIKKEIEFIFDTKYASGYRLIMPVVKYSNMFTSNIASDLILNYIDGIKSLLSVSSMLAKMMIAGNKDGHVDASKDVLMIGK